MNHIEIRANCYIDIISSCKVENPLLINWVNPIISSEINTDSHHYY